MWGFIISTLSIIIIPILSIIIFSSGNLNVIWIFLELASLSLIPSFVIISKAALIYSALIYYIVVSCLASAMFVSGCIYSDLWMFSLGGLMMKLGLFPFFFWIYFVGLKSNWYVVWGFSSFLKSSIFLIPVLFGYGILNPFDLLASLTFILLSLLFWCLSYNWFSCWIHMMLSSTALLIIVAFTSSPIPMLWLFVVYVLWSTLVILFLSLSSRYQLNLGWWFVYAILLLATPFSVALFYKLAMTYCMSSCSILIVCSWLVYNISEQIYLFSWAVNNGFPRSSSSFSNSL